LVLERIGGEPQGTVSACESLTPRAATEPEAAA